MTEPAKTGAPAAATSELRFLDPARLRFARQGMSLTLTLAAEAMTYDQVIVLRSFPLSQPDRYWSIRNEKNEEIGMLADPAQLELDQRTLLLEELRRRYLLPAINRIINIREHFETLEWLVETDHGPWRFTTRQLRDNLRSPAVGRFIITDIEGNRFDIPNIAHLPLASQTLLLMHL